MNLVALVNISLRFGDQLKGAFILASIYAIKSASARVMLKPVPAFISLPSSGSTLIPMMAIIFRQTSSGGTLATALPAVTLRPWPYSIPGPDLLESPHDRLKIATSELSCHAHATQSQGVVVKGIGSRKCTESL